MKPGATQYALLCLRVSLFMLMIVWAALKIANPSSYGGAEDNPGIFQNFYSVAIGPSIVLMLGILQIALLVAFVIGAYKTITYGAITLMNLASLLVVLPNIFNAFSGPPAILFVASIPVFGATLALFLMRDQDYFLSFAKKHV